MATKGSTAGAITARAVDDILARAMFMMNAVNTGDSDHGPPRVPLVLVDTALMSYPHGDALVAAASKQDKHSPTCVDAGLVRDLATSLANAFYVDARIDPKALTRICTVADMVACAALRPSTPPPRHLANLLAIARALHKLEPTTADVLGVPHFRNPALDGIIAKPKGTVPKPTPTKEPKPVSVAKTPAKAKATPRQTQKPQARSKPKAGSRAKAGSKAKAA